MVGRDYSVMLGPNQSVRGADYFSAFHQDPVKTSGMKTEPFQFPGIFLEYFQSQPLISKQVIYGWLIVLVWLSIALVSRMKSLSWIIVLLIQLWKAQVMSHLPLSKDIHSLQLKFLNPVPLFRDSETVIFFLRLIHAKTLLWTFLY